MKEWTQQEVLNDLPKIRRLKGVAQAYLIGCTLYVRTQNLRHPKSFRKLAPLQIAIPVEYGEYSDKGYKYVRSISTLLNRHPAFDGSNSHRRIGKDYYRNPCVGDGNQRDYLLARQNGPLMTVIQQLAMLQTVTKSRI